MRGSRRAATTWLRSMSWARRGTPHRPCGSSGSGGSFTSRSRGNGISEDGGSKLMLSFQERSVSGAGVGKRAGAGESFLFRGRSGTLLGDEGDASGSSGTLTRQLGSARSREGFARGGRRTPCFLAMASLKAPSGTGRNRAAGSGRDRGLQGFVPRKCIVIHGIGSRSVGSPRIWAALV